MLWFGSGGKLDKINEKFGGGGRCVHAYQPRRVGVQDIPSQNIFNINILEPSPQDAISALSLYNYCPSKFPSYL